MDGKRLDIGDAREDKGWQQGPATVIQAERKSMRVTRSALFACVALFAGLALSGTAKADDPQSGTWKLNTAKTKYNPGPAPKSLTLTIIADEKSYTVHTEGTDGAGKPMGTDFTAPFDGKDVPAKGIPYGDTVSVKRVNANTVEVTMKKDGKALVTVTSVVSKDGKTRTSTFVGKDEAGHDVHNVAVYDKQ